MQQLINGLALGSTYVLVGVGVTLIWGLLRILTFVHVQVLTWGTFVTLWLLRTGLPVPLAVLLGMLFGGVVYVAIDATVLRPLRSRNAGEFSYVIVTIGLALVLETVLRMLTGGSTEAFPRDGFPKGALQIGSLSLPWLHLATLAIGLLCVAVLSLWLHRSSFGRSLRAVAYSRDDAELLGINSGAAYRVAFFISGMITVLAGVFIAASTASLSYSSASHLLLVAVAVIILGGMGSVAGACAGGLILGVVEVMAQVHLSSELRDAIALLFILLVLVLRPSGLMGRAEASRV
ncbi:branched-chain amino acid ABC transporter permease [Actinomadura sp. 7K507]|uniref:branched-chain amino acid ABC transporter permease n=1 Tax=Actinomadura sp. 7K507 TaxID=2530365 RepID=UPI00104A0764|nr:branched-chain amino acid ABC transporter permease [Actinomadura sp. 7K507]TDC85701.1 branched-chain amino acid ABC transporter permease [Actinomadura sp. 7K507]